MGELRDKMIMEMELRNMSTYTIKNYLGHMVGFTRFFGKSPSLLGTKEIREYLYYLKTDKKLSWVSMSNAYSSLKFFYVETLHMDWDISWTPRPKGEQRLPVVLSPSEVRKLIDSISNLKHRVLLMTTYSGGLRVSETRHLKIPDIDSKRMVIRVHQGKGKKDRYTLLSRVLLEELRHYYREYRPVIWLFPGMKEGSPISSQTIQRVINRSKKKAGILKAATVHTLRHSFATHFLEQGGDVFELQELLGHSSLNTTRLYVHIQRKSFQKILNPLDRIMKA